MSADLNTEITLGGGKEELVAFLSVLKSYETHKHEQYIELVELESGTETAALRELDEDGIRRFVEAAESHITVSAFGPWGAFGELGDVHLFERLSEAAPNASFEGSMNGFVTGADVALEAALMDGKVHFSELYLPDEERAELEEEYGEDYEDVREELEEEFMEHYTYDPVTKEYENQRFGDPDEFDRDEEDEDD